MPITNLTTFGESFIGAKFGADLFGTCRDVGKTVGTICRVNFTLSDGTNSSQVQAYGNVKISKSLMEPNPDIAGVGVLFSFTPSFFLCVLCWAILYRGHRKRIPNPSYLPLPEIITKDYNDSFRVRLVNELLMLFADAMLLLVFVYCINFGVSSKCDMSAYHYTVAVNLIIIALASTTMSVFFSRDYWGRLISAQFLVAVVRTCVSIVTFAFFLRFLVDQVGMLWRPENMVREKSGTDSSLLLPMVCFFDPNLGRFDDLTKAQQDKLDWGVSISPEIFLGFLTVGLYVLAHISRVLNHDGRDRPKYSVWWAYSGPAVLMVVYYTFVCGFCWGRVFVIRRWVHKSGWMGSGKFDENNLWSIGQLLPILTMVWVFLLAFHAAYRPRESGRQDQEKPRPPRRRRRC